LKNHLTLINKAKINIKKYKKYIDLILIKGQVLDNKNLRLVFIDVCEYDKEKQETNIYNSTEYKDYNNIKINCPITPYMNFEKILKKNYK
jgi:hypothetical protein